MDDDDADGDVVGADEAYDLDDVGELNLATMVVADHASTVTATSTTTPKPVSTKAFRRALGSGMRTIPCRGRDRVTGRAFWQVRSCGHLTGDRSPAPGADLNCLSALDLAVQTCHLHPPGWQP